MIRYSDVTVHSSLGDKEFGCSFILSVLASWLRSDSKMYLNICFSPFSFQVDRPVLSHTVYLSFRSDAVVSPLWFNQATLDSFIHNFLFPQTIMKNKYQLTDDKHVVLYCKKSE